jgi:hypothetical protein
MEKTLRRLNERRALCDVMLAQAQHEEDAAAARRWEAARAETLRAGEAVRRFLTRDWARPEHDERVVPSNASSGDARNA